MANDRDDTHEDTDRDDELPRRKRRRDDDDRDEPRPRKKTNVALILGLVFGGMLLLSIPCIAVLIALLLPAVQKVRQAAGRAQDQNNMKQIALAFHNYHDVNGSMNGPYHSENGKVNRGLSWRVSFLPYLEQDNIFRMMDRDAAWDSPANSAATAMLIPAYTSPYDKGTGKNSTPYKIFVGGGALFDDTPGARPLTLASVSDGTSNTILCVEATDQVPWAAPQDIRYSRSTPLPKFGHPNGAGNGFNVAMADGSVRFMTSPVNEATFRAMIERADGR